jgi:hypothetical protein
MIIATLKEGYYSPIHYIMNKKDKARTIPDKKRTMTSEFMMENHWMFVCGIESRM